MAYALARIRVPLLWISIALVLVSSWLPVPYWVPLAVFGVAIAVYLRLGTVRRPPVVVGLPVSGRWKALNSPADQVPSHGVQAYGQTYAIDLVYKPSGNAETKFRWWPFTRRAETFPGFAQPVIAPVAGEVIRVHNSARDHASRTSWPALVYMLTLEGIVREARGPAGLLGNHVVIRTDDDTYALVAHLKQGSIRVEPGRRVQPGDLLAACGNSGSSSEPHVHFQLMDRPSPLIAAGLPVAFDCYEVDGEARAGVPSRAEAFVAPGGANGAPGATNGAPGGANGP